MQKNYKVTDQIYMDIEIDGKYTGRVIFGLFGETVPKTVKNFKEIALQGVEGKEYTRTKFLLAIKKVMILGELLSREKMWNMESSGLFELCSRKLFFHIFKWLHFIMDY